MGDKTKQFDSKGEKVQCRICDCWYHRLEVHLKKEHDITRKAYLKKYPGAPTISAAARKNASRAAKRIPPVIAAVTAGAGAVKKEESVPVDGPREFKVGVAKLRLVPDSELTALQKSEVPGHDENWMPGKREMEYMESIAVGIEDMDNIFIYGPPGGGKTTIVKEIGAITNTPVYIFQFSNGISLEDFIGETKLVTDEHGNNVTRWVDGAFTRCWREGYYIVFDEMTAAPANIMLRLHGVLDGSDLALIENGGEVIPRHERTRIFATDNTNGRGDDTGMFAGTNIMNEATLDRFGTVLKYSYPDEATERKILVAKSGIEIDVARKMVEVAKKVRESFANEECYCTFSTRRLIGWSKKIKRFGDVRKAADVAVLGKLGSEDAKFVESIIQRFFGGDFS
jgi:cobaltochelatase CobS